MCEGVEILWLLFMYNIVIKFYFVQFVFLETSRRFDLSTRRLGHVTKASS